MTGRPTEGRSRCDPGDERAPARVTRLWRGAELMAAPRSVEHMGSQQITSCKGERETSLACAKGRQPAKRPHGSRGLRLCARIVNAHRACNGVREAQNAAYGRDECTDTLVVAARAAAARPEDRALAI